MGRKESNQTNKGQLLWLFRLINSIIGQIDFHDDAALLTGVMLDMPFGLILNRKIIIFLGILSEFNWSAYQVLLKMNHVISFIPIRNYLLFALSTIHLFVILHITITN